ncbi:MAG: hypothetical protein NC924_09145 [Candidatus Omnitrophica bacterium]|nr:hypothetical protein [Candidatus Omnitrophota bacterium]
MRARENPFRVERLEALPFIFQMYDWPALDRRLAALSYRAAILGRQGTGKTTLLLELSRRLRQQGSAVQIITVRRDERAENLREVRHAYRRLGASDILCIDGADGLPWPVWRAVRSGSRRLRGLIVTSHTRRLLPVLFFCRSDGSVLEQILRHLLPTSVAEFSAQTPQLLRRHRGNIRNVLREMYDRYAEMNCSDTQVF